MLNSELRRRRRWHVAGPLPPSVRRRRRRAFTLFEMMVAFMLVGAMGFALAITLARHEKVSWRLAERRIAMEQAQAALLELQQDKPPTSPADATLHVQKLEAPSPVKACSWVEVRITRDRDSASLIGLLRTNSIPSSVTPEATPP